MGKNTGGARPTPQAPESCLQSKGTAAAGEVRWLGLVQPAKRTVDGSVTGEKTPAFRRAGGRDFLDGLL
jgi:hypothetical protein